MGCLKFHEFFNNLLGLPVIIENDLDLRSKRKGVLYLLYQRITEFTVLLGVILQAMAVPSVWEDMNVLCGCLASSAHSIQVLFKTILLNYYQKDFRLYLERIASVQASSEKFELKFLNMNDTFAKYYSKESRYVRLVLLTHFAITCFSTSAYFLPFVFDSIANYDNVDGKLTPIVIYQPFDINWTPIFQFIIILLTVCFYLNNLKTVVVDNFILGLIILSMSHFRYQKELLKNAVAKYCDKDGNDDVEVDEKSVLREWIIAHQDLLKATSQFGKVISPYLFLEFIYILVHTCVPAFVITSTFSWTIPQKMAVFFIVGGGLIELLLMSMAGDNFSQAWETIERDLFRPDLCEKKKKWTFHFFTMARLRLKKPFHFSAFKMFPLGCATFVTISRLIVSHYMTLNQIQTLKSGKNN